jgi:sn-glycerol 3-phosphate transport system permease protein
VSGTAGRRSSARSLSASLNRSRTARRWSGLLLILPGLSIILAFTIWPALHVAYFSLYAADLAHIQPAFIGLANYQYELSNPVFHQVLRNTFLYAAGTVPVSIVLALALALALGGRLRGRGVFRTAFFYPTVLPTIGAAAIWLFIYIPNLGLADRLLALFHVASHNWLGDPALVMPALMVVGVWKQSGYFMIFYIAALQGISPEIFEAGALDGARGLRRLWSLTVPLLWGTTVFVSTVALVNAFQTVDQLFLLTQGGPSNASSLLLYFVYQEGFINFNLGRASAVTVIMLALVLAISVMNYRYLDRRAHYDQ